MRNSVQKISGNKPHSNDKTAIRRNRREARQDPENAPAIGAMRRLHKSYGVELDRGGYSSKVVMKILHKHIGKKYNDVYSMILKKFKKTPHERYILDIILDYLVEKNTIEMHGIVYSSKPVSKYYDSTRIPLQDQFFVNGDGVLLYADKANYDNHQEYIQSLWKEKRIIADSKTQYHKIKGVWYEIKLNEITTYNISVNDSVKKYYPSSFHHINNSGKIIMDSLIEEYANLLRGNCTFERNADYILRKIFDTTYSSGILLYPISKKQLNSNSIKRLMKYVQHK